MKKILLATIIFTVLIGTYLWADLPRLWGGVEYSTGGGVGSNRPVDIYVSPFAKDGTAYTDGSSCYYWSYQPPKYFYEVRCDFLEGNAPTHWLGETIIDATISTDYRVNITVYAQ